MSGPTRPEETFGPEPQSNAINHHASSNAMRSVFFFLGLALIAVAQHGLHVAPTSATSAKSTIPNVLLGAVMLLTDDHGRGAWLATAMGVMMVVYALVPRRGSKSRPGRSSR